MNKDIQCQLQLSYESLVDIVERLKFCQEIATNRTSNWQRFCIHHEDILPFLLKVCCLLDEGTFIIYLFFKLKPKKYFQGLHLQYYIYFTVHLL